MKKYLLYLVLYIFVLSCKENDDRLVSNQVSYNIDKVKIEKKLDDMFAGAKEDYGTPCYGNMIYDKYRNIYYRLAYPKVELEDGVDYISLTSQGRKKFSIIILDEKFNIIGETLFPEYTYNSTVLFVHQDGLYICNNHPKNPEFNEDILSFQCFELTKNKSLSLKKQINYT
ncbi:hypothetical protein AGMMS50239_38830 [Bacteroidia bacterium]|nr:hypothetical protein AGMMS50239_38830 [Bacteroidia bacterium]